MRHSELIIGTGYTSLYDYRRQHGMSEAAEMNLRQRVARIMVAYKRRLRRDGIFWPNRGPGASILDDYKAIRRFTKALDEIDALKTLLEVTV